MPRFHSCNVKVLLLGQARPHFKGEIDGPCHLWKKPHLTAKGPGDFGKGRRAPPEGCAS